jgi:hypothetical protein
LDNIFFTRFARENESSDEIEAALKLHSVTSNSIILPVDQLRFPATIALLNAQPQLIENGIIKFVIGSDKLSIVDYLGERIGQDESSRDLIQTIEATPNALKTYRQPDTYLTFNRLFWTQLEEPWSFTRTYGGLSRADFFLFESVFERDGIKGRELYEFINHKFNGEKRQFLKNLAEYVYLYAGAKNTGSRLILPQQELINWSDASAISTDFEISDKSLFIDVLVENIVLLADDLSDLEHMGLVTDTNFQKLSFEDIYALRSGINFGAFVDRYIEMLNRCETLTANQISDDIFQDAEQLLLLREDLIRTFNQEAKADVASYRYLKGAEGFVAFFSSVLGVSYGIRSLINSFAVVIKREKEYKDWQHRRLIRIQKATSWGRDKISGGNVIPFLLDVEKRILKNLAKGH